MTKKANTPVKTAKKPPAFIEAPEPDDEDKRSPLDREQDRQERAIADVLSREKVQGGTIQLSRRSPGEATYGYLAEIPAETYSEENVKLIYGGGDYKAQVKTSDGKFKGNFQFKIDYSIPSKHPEKREEKKENDVAAIIAAVTAAMKSSAPVPVAPAGPDPMTMKLIEGMFMMMGTMMTNKPTGADPAMAAQLAEIRGELRAMKEAGGGGGGGGLNGFFNNFSKFKELIADSIPESAAGGGGGGGEEKPDRGMQALSLFAPLINAVGEKVLLGNNQPVAQQAAAEPEQPQLTNGATPAAATTPAAAGLPAAATNGTAANGTAKPALPMNAFSLFLPEFRRVAILAATKNRDPFDWVEDKLASIPVKFHVDVFNLANRETWFADIFGTDQKAMERLAWLLDMRNSILLLRFVAEAEKAFAQQVPARPTPEKFASDFIDGASVSSLEKLFDYTDPAAWDMLFPSTSIDPTWLEAVRVALDKELSGEDEEKDEDPALDKVTKDAMLNAAAAATRTGEQTTAPKKKKP